jgi:hypothetical protein
VKNSKKALEDLILHSPNSHKGKFIIIFLGF